MTTTRFGIVIVGDEILSGKRQDKHLAHAVQLLAARGLELAWARYVGDDHALLVQTYRETFAGGDCVFSFGGIGATPDDKTRQAAAAATGRPLEPHRQGVEELRARSPELELTSVRLRLVEFPQGAELIPNPVNRVPGFSLETHHFLPGFPSMAWPMMAWVLDTRYTSLHAPGAIGEQVILLPGCRESQIVPLMERFLSCYPSLRMSSLPHADVGNHQLELGLRGEPALVAAAMLELQREVAALGLQWQPVTLPRSRWPR
jgi:molybdopterin-biosynthesis enzyme MoeA-like protein